MAKGYTDKTAIQNYLLINIDPQFDDQVDEWIEGVEEYIDSVTNRDFSPAVEDAETEDRTFSGDGTRTLTIDPNIEVEEVRFSVDGDPIDSDNYVTLPTRKPTITKLQLRAMNFPKGLENIYVKANWGYSKVPMDIKLAATVLVSGIINNAWQSEGEVQSMTVGRYSVTYKTKSQVDDFNKIEDILLLNKQYAF